MRSTHFVYSFSKLSETFIYDYLTSLKIHGVDVRVVTFNHLNKKERPFSHVNLLKLPWWNLNRIWSISRDKVLGKNIEISSWPAYRKRLKKMILDERPDVLHAHFGPMGVLLAPVAVELDIPLVVTFYGYDISQIVVQDFWKQAYKELTEIADSVTVLSEEMKKRALDIGFDEHQIEVIHLGTKLDKIPYKLPSYPIRHFLSVGRLSEKKGHMDTLEAFAKVLQQSDMPLKLTIIGDGEDKKKIEAYIQSEGLQKNVSIPGGLPHSKVLEHLYEADAFILNSKTATNGDREGTPTVLVEAQAAGLPCLSTFHSGIPEIIPPPNHRFLADEGNVPQIVSNIQNLMSEKESEIQKISSLGRKRVEEAFDIVREAEKLKVLYKELI